MNNWIVSEEVKTNSTKELFAKWRVQKYLRKKGIMIALDILIPKFQEHSGHYPIEIKLGKTAYEELVLEAAKHVDSRNLISWLGECIIGYKGIKIVESKLSGYDISFR